MQFNLCNETLTSKVYEITQHDLLTGCGLGGDANKA